MVSVVVVVVVVAGASGGGLLFVRFHGGKSHVLSLLFLSLV